MHTFSIIAQKVMNQVFPNKIDIVYFDEKINFEKSYFYYDTQAKAENTLSLDERRGAEKQFFMMYIMNNKISITSKFKFLQDVLENMFMNKESIERFLKLFSKIQRTYMSMAKFANACKIRNAKILMDKDFFLAPLTESHPRVFVLLENNKKYLFSITDLVNILNNSLGNSFFFVAEPLPCKNPYTNLPFNKSTLYNIYFFIKKTAFIMPHMFHQFFVSNFNLREYAEENEEAIRNYSIKQYIIGSDIEELYFEIISMLQSEKYGRKIQIDPEFPKEKLVDIMRPYLELFYKGTYTLNEIKRDKYIEEYNFKIKRFYQFNKRFGNRYMTRINSAVFSFHSKPTFVPAFNETHVNFYETKTVNDFLISHTCNVIDNH